MVSVCNLVADIKEAPIVYKGVHCLVIEIKDLKRCLVGVDEVVHIEHDTVFCMWLCWLYCPPNDEFV